ncbi:MAG: hypothetical protein MCS20_00530, partial [Candidatus Phytoplasma mali]|nr:hypothetical protein [Candidatus Phytoplasma mali]
MKLEDNTKSSTSQLQVLREFSHPLFFLFLFLFLFFYFFYFFSPYYILRTICLISLGVGNFCF